MRSVALSPDGNKAALGGSLGKSNSTIVEIWNVSKAAQVDRPVKIMVRPDVKYEVANLAWSADQKWLAISHGPDGTLWNVEAGRKQRTFAGGAGNIGFPEPIVFAPDDRALAKGDWNGNLEMQEIASGKMVRSFTAPNTNGNMEAMCFSPDGTELTSKDSFDFYIWDATTGESKRKIPSYAGGGALLSPDGHAIAGKTGNDLTLWHVP
jgi:WD40 repeat protein